MRGPLGGGFIGGGALAAPVIVAPALHQLAAVGVPVAIVVTVSPGTPSATAQFGGHAPIALSIIGSQATGSYTPVGGDVSNALALSVVAAGFTVNSSIDVEPNNVFWIDSANPSSYVAAGSALSAITSLISGTPLSTKTGLPTIVTSPCDGRPAFAFPGASAPGYFRGADATALAAVVGTDKQWTAYSVVNVDDCAANGIWASLADAASASLGQEFGQLSTAPGFYSADRVGTLGYHAATVVKALAGVHVVRQRSLDGVSILTQVDGGAEINTVLTSAGAVSATQVAIGAAGHLVPSIPFGGYLREFVLFSSGTTDPLIGPALLAKWKQPPQVQFIGDSITTAQLVHNGGMVAATVARVRALGGVVDPQGPIPQTNGVGAEVWYPYRYSAVSGNTCTQMNTRVNDASQGIGSAAGHYLNTDVVCVMAGTNMETDAPTTATAYTTLLNSIYTALTQGTKPPKIAVTTICGITLNLAYSLAFNALLPGIWATFESAHPGVLIYWDAFLACPNDGSNTLFLDGTHPNDAGYDLLNNDPSYGLLQAIVPYLMSVQP